MTIMCVEKTIQFYMAIYEYFWDTIRKLWFVILKSWVIIVVREDFTHLQPEIVF